MKKLTAFSLVLLTGIMSCTAQKTETRQAGAFTRLKLLGSVNVTYTSSDTMELKVTAADKEISNVLTQMDGETLVIENKGTFKSPVNVYIKNPSLLSSIECAGATWFKSSNMVKSNNISIDLTGASNAELNTVADKINCEQSGASNAKIKGRAGELSLNIGGAANFKGYELTVNSATVTSSGASKAKIFATDKIKATANGASTIRIKGDPKEVTAESTPAASVGKVSSQVSKSESEGDTVIYNLKNKKIIVVTKDDVEEVREKDKNHESDISEFKHWKGFTMAANGYFNTRGGLNVPKQYNYMDLDYSHSFNFQFNIIERHFNIHKNYVKIVTGMGFDYHIYALANRVNLNPDTSFTWGVRDSSGANFLKNRMRCTYLQVPLLLEFNTSSNPDKTFHIACGVIGEYLIASRTKQVLEINKTEFKRVNKDNYNLTPFALKAHVNAGYGGWTLFAEYNLTPLFDHGKGPELYPFNAGIRIIPFT